MNSLKGIQILVTVSPEKVAVTCAMTGMKTIATEGMERQEEVEVSIVILIKKTIMTISDLQAGKQSILSFLINLILNSPFEMNFTI